MSLDTVWFVVVAFFWTGFFVLEGFDFGVGMLHGYVGRDDNERRVVINTVGPVWDGNEVWLIVAGASMFAAFPAWYATWFSALYLALLLVLAGLIVRGVSFEFRGKYEDARWRSLWSATLTVGSAVVPLLLGVGLGDLLAGLPLDSQQQFTGGFVDLLTPYGLLTGVTLVVLCLWHGGEFLGIRTTGDLRDRAVAVSRSLALPVLVLVLVLEVWTEAISDAPAWATLVAAVPVLAAAVAAVGLLMRRATTVFVATTVTIGGVVASLFAHLYPDVLVSSTSAANSLTVSGAASSSYTLRVMTVVAAVLLPLVLLYQGWSYYVFRARVVAPPDPPRAPTETAQAVH